MTFPTETSPAEIKMYRVIQEVSSKRDRVVVFGHALRPSDTDIVPDSAL